MPDWKTYWADAKKGGREWYDANLRDFIEFYLRKINLTYCVDMDNSDFANITSLHQKRDRQIIFLFAGVCMVLEYVWDFIMGGPAGTPKKRGKSIISNSKEDVKPDVKPASPSKTKRDKIE